MTELIEKEGKEIGQIMKENWRNLSNFSLASNGVRRMDGQSISEVFFTKDKFYGFLPVWKWINMQKYGYDWVKWINMEKGKKKV